MFGFDPSVYTSAMQYLLSFYFTTLLLLSVIDDVMCHGFVHYVVAGGQTYPGWNPFVDPYASPPPNRIVRKVLSDGFVAANDPDLACHHGGREGTGATADVPAGAQLTFQWSYWPADHQGPVSTYMTSCNGDCSTFVTDNAKWFKLDADGYDPSSKQWAADKLRANNNSWTSTIPSGLAPGQYLIRNEIVALHSSSPQFYPSCSQINVSGTGTGQPSSNDLVSIPGLYNGVTFPDIYSDFGNFSIPGPPSVTLTDLNGGNGSPPPSASTSALSMSMAGTTSYLEATQASTATPVSTSPVSSNHCRLTRKTLAKRRWA
ncbi:hypothetical protein AX17_001485 [Amanita inopinata Kibby_2008]|nr:hypothetical protein AX17_001485 [Amanita inopinata Kibby_2008]